MIIDYESNLIEIELNRFTSSKKKIYIYFRLVFPFIAKVEEKSPDSHFKSCLKGLIQFPPGKCFSSSVKSFNYRHMIKITAKKKVLIALINIYIELDQIESVRITIIKNQIDS